MTNGVLHIDGAEVREGTSIYDTEYDRVLWITDIDDYEISIDTVESYEDDDPVWWSADGDPRQVGTGSSIDIDEFSSLIEHGRFEVGSQPCWT